MKRMISLVFMIFGATVLLQGCYTILDLPEIYYDEYVSTPDPIYDPEPPSGPIPHPPIPRPPYHPHPPIVHPIIIVQPANPSPPYTREDDIQKIRDNGNGRGNLGRNTDVNKSTETRTDTNSSANNNSSSNSDDTRGSSDSGNSGNIRR